MSERQPRSGSEGRMSSSPPRPLRRVRMLTTGRWHAPLDARLMPTVIAVGAAERGLGKSIVVSNLAASIAGLGRRVVVVDLDFRAPRRAGADDPRPQPAPPPLHGGAGRPARA